MIELALIGAFLITFAIFLGAVAVAIVAGQRSNRKSMRQMEAEFERIVSRLGDEQADGR